MANNQLTSRLLSLKGIRKDRQNTVLFIRNLIEKTTEVGFSRLVEEYPEDKRYRLALNHITTSNKAICEALDIPVEAGCRYKKHLEDDGLLVASVDKFECPYTGEMVQFLSTNPSEFERLTKSVSNQLNLFENE
jgi:hypothetical protein